MTAYRKLMAVLLLSTLPGLLAAKLAWADLAPVVTAPASVDGFENTPIFFTVTASDPDGDAITNLTMDLLSTGATFTRNATMTSGSFSWTPTYAQSGVYDFPFTASNALTGSATTRITVQNVDRAPVVTAPPPAMINMHQSYTATAFASDPDGNPITSFTASPLPSGATFTANASNTAGTFAWTPSSIQGGSHTVTFTASNALSGSASTTLTVTTTDNRPVVTAPGFVQGDTNAWMTFTVSASDPDGDAIVSLTASGTAITAGGTFTANAANTSGTFSWTPVAGQEGNYAASFLAANALSGSAQTNITVTLPGDHPPVVTAPATAFGGVTRLLQFTVSASDPDGPITSLTASGTAITAGASFTSNGTNTSGTFSWTPTFMQTGSYAVTFTAANALTGTATTAITIGSGADRPPLVTAPANQAVPINTLLAFTVSAADPDGDPINSLTAAPLPSGATFTSNVAHTSGTFSWTPNNAQVGIYTVVFTASNALSGSATTQIQAGISDRAPVVLGPFTFTIVAGAQGSFQVTATDPDGDPISSFTASGTAMAAGGTFTKNAANTSGTFTWTPTSSQLGSYSATFLASNALSGSVTTLISVVQDLLAPVVTAPSLVTGTENTLITFTVSATDPDDAITSLTAAPLPPGATFSANATHTSGTFNWTPSLSQSGTYDVTFTASNSMVGLATTRITVRDVCNAPVADAGGPYSGVAGVPIPFDGTGSSDPAGGTLGYLWYFGDGASGTGPTPSHTYATPGFYQVQLTVTSSCGAAVDVTSIVIYDNCISSFTVGGNQALRLNSGKQTWCVQMEPFPSDCFAASDVDISSITLEYTGGSVTQIHALTDKTSVSGGDRNGNGVQEITACFSKDDLRLLFSGLPSGYSGVVATVRLRLVTGGQVSGQIGIRVFSNGSALAASVSPNPFNPRAVLSFRTTREGFARGRLFDASGRLVRTLLDERSLAVGYHEVVLDGRGTAGESLPSGIYYYRMETGEGTASGRVVLLK